jgi:anthranilate phosphoribosyltransferase
MVKEVLKQIIAGKHLSKEEASAILNEIIDGEVTDAQIAAILIALAAKGETADELAGFASVMRQRAANFTTKHRLYVDTSGTGGDGQATFNISTTAAFVIAGAGVPVAKHGNRAVSSQCGSADVLSELGIKIILTPELAAQCLDEIGICFMFAPAFHTATKRVAEIRKQLGVRTAFNLLGPLTNPARTPRQLAGVFSPTKIKHCAEVLSKLGTERAWVVCGADGLDEITLTDKTYVGEVIFDKVSFFEVLPEDFGFNAIKKEELVGGTTRENAEILKEILSGDRKDSLRKIVLANAAAVLYLCDKASNLKEAVDLAASSIDQGKALEKLQALINLSQATNSSEK